MSRWDLVTLDGDTAALAAFWTAALGLVELEREDGDRWVVLGSGDGRRLLGLQRGETRPGSVHLDLACRCDEFDDELTRLVGLGARLASAPRAEPYGRIANLTDPGGTPFDLCAYQDAPAGLAWRSSSGSAVGEATDAGCRTGLWLYPDAPAERLLAAVQTADAAGVDEIWIADEGVAREPGVLLAAAAATTRHIRLGVGITTPVLRHPGALAASTATLDELSGGRAILGLGVGGHESLGPFGLGTDRPVGLVAEAIGIARAVMERRPVPGYEPPRHAAPARTVPIVVGARGPQMLAMASRLADGVLLSGLPLDAIGQAIEWSRAHRPIDVILHASARVSTAVDGDPAALGGSPADIGRALRTLAEQHRPTSVGLALVDGRDPVEMVEEGIEALRRFSTRE